MPATLAELTTAVTDLLTSAGIFSLIGLVGAFGAVIAGGGLMVRRLIRAFR